MHSSIKSFTQSLLLFVALAGLAVAADLKVIANPEVAASNISVDELKRIFLQTKTSLNDGTRVEPVLAKGGAAHEAFLKEILGKNDSALQAYYRSLVFTGKGSMPKTVASDADVAAYVAKTKGAIGYVSSGADVSGVKTLDIR